MCRRSGLKEFVMRTILLSAVFATCLVSFLGSESFGREAKTHEEFMFLIAVRDGDIEAVRKATSDALMDVNMTKGGFPALHFAALKGHIEVARILINAGADVNARDAIHGTSAIEIADERGDVAFVRFLKLAGAESPIGDYTEDYGETKALLDLYDKEEGFWEGAKKQKTLQEGFQYGFERGVKGDLPSHFYLLWLAIIGVFALVCWKGAEKRGRNPWIWGGLTLVAILLPLLCWVPYVVLRIMGETKNDKAS